MKKNVLISILVFFVSVLSIQAQVSVMEETVGSTYNKSKFGINRTHFSYTYIRFSFILRDTQQKGVETKFCSNTFSLGIRYKLRLNNFFSTGFETEYQINSVFYSPQDPNIKERINLQDLRNAWYFRFNFGKRGNNMGKGLDIGLWSGLTTSTRSYLKMNVSGQDYKTLEMTKSKLDYIEPFYYGFYGRVFWGYFSLYVEYRYSDILKKEYLNQYYNIPPLKIGVEVGIF